MDDGLTRFNHTVLHSGSLRALNAAHCVVVVVRKSVHQSVRPPVVITGDTNAAVVVVVVVVVSFVLGDLFTTT